MEDIPQEVIEKGFNPYFTGLPILIELATYEDGEEYRVSILILLDYLFLSVYPEVINKLQKEGFNPYFTGLPILIEGGKI